MKAIGSSAFSSCSVIELVTLRERVETICKNVFSIYLSLQNIAILSLFKSIGNNAFYDCSGLDTIDFGEGME